MLTSTLFLCLVVILPISSANDSNIAGGQDAVKGQYPWLVNIEVTNFVESWPLCGGILITDEWVLTAAHCLDSEKPEWLWVVTGEHDREVEEGTEQRLTVSSFVKHPDYTYWQTPYQNDVGLIHLSTRAVLDSYTSLAPIADEGVDDVSGMCQVAGWGSTHDGGAGATILQWAPVPILDPQICEEAYGSAPDPNALCAGEVTGGVGTCAGDNGGGLLCWSEKTGRQVVGGVMSWREGCALPGKPAFYMNVAKYRDWIMSIINP
ncbi:trypsin-1-like isoform X1 [Macrobrachium rosenbergii]|uniref:trypsin-1-like isoform X1 n=1 Tax=Macrobrachium rosenbergii TaxID=79674 RepID=UPI0034D3B7DD